MTTLFTIGYEGVGLENWIEILKDNEISLVIDVREKPISRKKGFSKRSLCNALKENDIKYIHMGILGSPGEIRSELHNTHNYPSFFRKYLSYLCKQSGAIKALLDKASRQKGTCLMCFEKDPLKCHRSILTEYLLTNYPNDIKVEHL